MLVTVRQVNDRPTPIGGFDTIRVQLRLLTTSLDADGHFLRFKDCQRFPVVTPKDVVDVTDSVVGTVSGRHPFDFEFFVVGPVEVPASLSQQFVDDERPCLCLVPVLFRDRNFSGGGFRFGDLPAQVCQFRFGPSQRVSCPFLLCLLLGQLRFELLAFLERFRFILRFDGSRCGSNLTVRSGLTALRSCDRATD